MGDDERRADFSPEHYHRHAHFDDSPSAWDEALAPHANFLHKAEVMTLRFVLYIVFIVLIIFVLTHAMGCNKCGGQAADDKGSSSADTKKCSPNCTVLNTLAQALDKAVNWFMQYGILFMLGLAVITKLPTDALVNAWGKSKGSAEQEIDGLGADTAEKLQELGEARYKEVDKELQEEHPDMSEAERDEKNDFSKWKPEEV